jgi:hypothetical protein
MRLWPRRAEPTRRPHAFSVGQLVRHRASGDLAIVVTLGWSGNGDPQVEVGPGLHKDTVWVLEMEMEEAK